MVLSSKYKVMSLSVSVGEGLHVLSLVRSVSLSRVSAALLHNVAMRLKHH